MPATVTTEQVWTAVEKQLFAVLGFTTPRQESRTAGIVYVVVDRKLYIGSGRDAWKVKHIAKNPHVSLTVTIHKGIPLMPFIKIPPATITFSGTARILDVDDVSPAVIEKLYRGMEVDQAFKDQSAVIEITPEKDFLTYGVGVSLMTMRNPAESRGRAPVA